MRHPPSRSRTRSTSPTSSTPASRLTSTTASGCSSARPAGRRLARQPRARDASRRPHLLQLQHPARGHQRLRRELSVLLVRAPASRATPGAYTMSLEQAWDKLRQRAPPAADRGPHRQRPASRSAVRLLHGAAARASSASVPTFTSSAFTAVEIAFFADLYGMTDEQVLRELMAAGLDSLPGRRRRDLRRARAPEDLPRQVRRRPLPRDSPHRARLGMRSNVTMLTGTSRRLEERVDHMLRARALQDETGGFQAFIPLAFHPDNNQMRKLPAPTRRRHAARARGGAADARQHSAHQGVLDRDRRRGGADVAVVRRRRSRRHRAGRAHLPHGRRAHARSDDDRRRSGASSTPPAASPSSATRCTT